MTERKKILYVCPTSGIGGAETFVRMTASHKNIDPHYILFQNGPLADWLVDKKTKVLILNSPPRLKNLVSYLKIFAAIKNYIQLHKIDLVHSTMAYAALFAAWPAYTQKTKHIWFQHGPAAGFMDQLAALFPNQLVLCNSEYTLNIQSQLEKNFIFSFHTEKKVLPLASIHHSPTDSEKQMARMSLRQEFDLPDNTFILGMFCRFQSWKGVHVLIAALKNLKPELPLNFKAILWGESFKDDSYKVDMQNLATTNQLPILFPGGTESPHLKMRGCDLVVNASITAEPFGLSIIESMSQKTAVLAPREGGPLEIINDNVDGFLFSPRDEKDLGLKILDLIKNKNKLNLSAEQGLKKSKNEFSIDQMISQLERYYQMVLNE